VAGRLGAGAPVAGGGGTWALLEGVLQIVGAVRLGRWHPSRWLLGASGVVAMTFGILLGVSRLPGTAPIVWLVGGYALVTGALLLGLAGNLLWSRRRGPEVAGVDSTGVPDPAAWVEAPDRLRINPRADATHPARWEDGGIPAGDVAGPRRPDPRIERL
jgi:hypothetical protein